MKKLLLFLVLIFTTLNVYAQWVLVVTNPVANYYVKTDSIKRVGHIVTYWETEDYKSVQEVDEKQYSSTKIKKETNCNTEENRPLYISVYSESMGSGKAILVSKIKDKGFNAIIPDSTAHTVFRFVCNKK